MAKNEAKRNILDKFLDEHPNMPFCEVVKAKSTHQRYFDGTKESCKQETLIEKYLPVDQSFATKENIKKLKKSFNHK